MNLDRGWPLSSGRENKLCRGYFLNVKEPGRLLFLLLLDNVDQPATLACATGSVLLLHGVISILVVHGRVNLAGHTRHQDWFTIVASCTIESGAGRAEGQPSGQHQRVLGRAEVIALDFWCKDGSGGNGWPGCGSGGSGNRWPGGGSSCGGLWAPRRQGKSHLGSGVLVALGFGGGRTGSYLDCGRPDSGSGTSWRQSERVLGRWVIVSLLLLLWPWH